MKAISLSNSKQNNCPFNQSLLRKLQGPPNSELQNITTPLQKEIRDSIHEVFLEQFNENLPSILLISEADFFEKINKISLLLLKDLFKHNELSSPFAKETFKSIKKHLMNKYQKTSLLLRKTWNDHKILKTTSDKATPSFLKTFLKHCAFTDDFAYHWCSKNKKTKLIGIFNPDNSYKTITHAMCLECNKCFLSNSLLLYCNHCSVNYNSHILTEEGQSLFPAMWMKYHCGNNISDETMKCLKCSSVLYLNIKSKKWICIKTECKFEAEQDKIDWICKLCKNEFKSEAKIYNPSNIKLIKKAIQKALVLKEGTRPDELSCCKGELKGWVFYHKDNCSGKWFQGEYNESKIIVCEKCNAMNYSDRFIWTCPLCKKRFRNHKQRVNYITPCPEKMPSGNWKNVFNEIQFDARGSIDYNCKDSNDRVENPRHTMTNFSQDNKGSVLNSNRNNKYKTLVDIWDQRTPGIKHSFSKKISHNRNSTECKLQIKSQFTQEIKNNNLISPASDSVPIKYMKSTKPDNPKVISQKSSNNEIENSTIFWGGNQDVNNDNNNINRNVNNSLAINLCEIFDQDKSALFDITTPTNTNKQGDINNTENTLLDSNNSLPSNGSTIRQISSNSIYRNALNSNTNPISLVSLDHVISNSLIPWCDIDDDYKIINLIGEGSYGKIYLIKNLKTNQKFAMKKIIANDMKEVVRLQNEFELVYSNQHENIMKIFKIEYKLFDFSTYVIYVVMELALSDWNSQILNKRTPYKEGELVKIIYDIVQALKYLKDKNISHRDIKPQNIWIFNNSKYKLADFGEAKEIKFERKNNTLRGTELYMSPWWYNGLYNNVKNVNHDSYKSDVFSLGYCLWYAATRTLQPWYDIRGSDDMKEINNVILKYLKGVYSGLFIKMIMKMWETEERKRYSFEDWLSYLEKNLISK